MSPWTTNSRRYKHVGLKFAPDSASQVYGRPAFLRVALRDELEFMNLPSRHLRRPLLGMLLAVSLWAQSAPTADSGDRLVPELAAENNYYLANRLAIPAGSVVQVPQHGRDAILIMLGDAMAEFKLEPSDEPQNLGFGEVRFLSRGSHPILTSDNALEILVVELKQHWDPEMRLCTEPAKCRHTIRMDSKEIGDSTSLFTNGFITAYRHHLVIRATLTSSYYSANGKDHLLLVPLADLTATFDGTEKELVRGQVYPSEASQVEVDAAKQEARWIVIRVETKN
jgi:hypothetical protein